MGAKEFSRLLTRCRLEANLSKKELAAEGGVSRQMLTNWEVVRPPETAVPFKELNGLVAALRSHGVRISALDFLGAFGYDVAAEEVRNEQESSLLKLFRQVPPRYQRAALLGLQAVASEQDGEA